MTGLAFFSSMVSFKEITDLAVLSYRMNFINAAEFLLLYNIAQKTFICHIICIPSSTSKISTKMNVCQNFIPRKLTSQGFYGLYKSLMT